jgi:uncharacterized membrane protein HdeD (DUF308 family)
MTTTGFTAEPRRRAPGPLLNALAKHWWLFLVRGIVAIVFGLLAFFTPGATLVALVLLWAIYAIADGVSAIWASFSGANAGARWWLLLAGASGVLAGAFAVIQPAIAALAFLMIVGIWTLAVGVMQVIGAIRLRKEIDGEWWLLLTGVVNILFGVFLLAQPVEGAVAIGWLIGTFAILIGVFYVFFALRLRKLRAA